MSLEYVKSTELLFKKGCCIDDELLHVKYGMVWYTLERDSWDIFSEYGGAGYTELVFNVAAIDIVLVDVK